MKKLKGLWYALLAGAFILVTLFGLGPVLFADGSMGERFLTLAVVVVLYILIVILFIRIKNQSR